MCRLVRAAERDPRNPDAKFHLGNLHREQGRFAAAVAAYEAAAALAPDHPGLRNNLGLAHEGAGDPERAIAAYRAALAAQPGHRQALGNLAHLLCRLRRYGEATQLCEDYLRRYGDADATIWTDHGICAQYARDLDTALASLERARSLAPNDALILVNLGSVLVLRGDYDAAQEVLAQACALEPSLALRVLAACPLSGRAVQLGGTLRTPRINPARARSRQRAIPQCIRGAGAATPGRAAATRGATLGARPRVAFAASAPGARNTARGDVAPRLCLVGLPHPRRGGAAY